MRDITAKAVEGTDNDTEDYFALADQPKWSEDPRFLRSRYEKEGDNFQDKIKSGGRNLQSTWNPQILPSLTEMDKHIPTEYSR
jgi:hypothetical protein